jgi:hypothetical protein
LIGRLRRTVFTYGGSVEAGLLSLAEIFLNPPRGKDDDIGAVA